MADRTQNGETVRFLDDFICQAIPHEAAVDSLAPGSIAGRGQGEPISMLDDMRPSGTSPKRPTQYRIVEFDVLVNGQHFHVSLTVSLADSTCIIHECQFQLSPQSAGTGPTESKAALRGLDAKAIDLVLHEILHAVQNAFPSNAVRPNELGSPAIELEAVHSLLGRFCN